MKETFEKVKEELVEYLLEVDQAQLSMMDLSAYVSIVRSVNDMLKDDTSIYDKILSTIGNGCSYQPPAVPMKGVQDNG